MSQKRSILNSLKKIKSLFDDEGTHQSVDALMEKVNTLDDKKPSKITNFPVPAELESATDYATFSDGACRGNPGPGSWGVMAQDNKGNVLFEAASFDEETTNNRMELLGAQKSLELLADRLEEDGVDKMRVKVFLFSDSKYVVQGLNAWRYNWKKKGWKKSDNKTVDNKEYWVSLDEETEKFFAVQAMWVKGHSNHPQNERCDQLCNEILDKEGF